MRFRVVLAVAALAFAIAPVARAASLPDLPGMGPAQKAVGGNSVATTSSAPATRTKRTLPVTATSSSSQASVTDSGAKAIRNLPGAGALPVIGKAQRTSARSAIPGQDTLVVLAALGSFAALAALYMLRRLNRI